MPAFDVVDLWLRKPWVLAASVSLVCLWALHLAIPHVGDEIWQDEAATLLAFSRHGALFSFLHYMAANNHVLFSVMAAFWMQIVPGGVTVASLRLLPILMFVAAVPMCFLAARRMGGIYCGLLASLLFATSGIASDFAAQLRGYGPSWFFICAMLLCAMNVFAIRAVAWRGAYFLSAIALVGMVPSNFYLALSVAVASSMFHAMDPGLHVRKSAPGFACLLLAPFAGLLVYAAVWSELMEAARAGASHWTLLGLLGNWLRASTWPLLWLAPLFLVGLMLGAREACRAMVGGKAVQAEWLLAVLLPTGMVVAVAVMPSVPYPRNLVPYLPVWLCSLAWLSVYGFRVLAARSEKLGVAAAALVLSGSALAAPGACTSTLEGQTFGYDLCYQYFHDNYHPTQVVDIWAQLEQPDLAIVSDYEGYLSLKVLDSPAHVFEYRHAPADLRLAPLLVAHGEADLQPMYEAMRLDPKAYGLVADTGYFKVYAPVRRPRKPFQAGGRDNLLE